MHLRVIPTTTTVKTGIVTAKTSAERKSIVKAIIIAPKTIIGERIISLSVMLSPDCTVFMSLVRRVIIEEEPIPSCSVKLKSWIWS